MKSILKIKQSKNGKQNSSVIFQGNNGVLVTPTFEYFFQGEGLPDETFLIGLENFETLVSNFDSNSTLTYTGGMLNLSNLEGHQKFSVMSFEDKIESKLSVENNLSSYDHLSDINWVIIFSFFKAIKSLLPESRILKLSKQVESPWFAGIEIEPNLIKATNNLVFATYNDGYTGLPRKVNIDFRVLNAVLHLGTPKKTYLSKNKMILIYDHGLLRFDIKAPWPDTSFLEIKAGECETVCQGKDFYRGIESISEFIENDRIYIDSSDFSNSVVESEKYAHREFDNPIFSINDPIPFSFEVLKKLKNHLHNVGYFNGMLVLKSYPLTFMVSAYK